MDNQQLLELLRDIVSALKGLAARCDANDELKREINQLTSRINSAEQ